MGILSFWGASVSFLSPPTDWRRPTHIMKGQKSPYPKSTTEKAMAPHSSTLAWKIPWAEEPGRLQSMGLLRVGHDWATSLSLFIFMHWRREWQPTPMLLPGESQGWGSLVGCRLWGCTVRHDWSDLAVKSTNLNVNPSKIIFTATSIILLGQATHLTYKINDHST